MKTGLLIRFVLLVLFSSTLLLTLASAQVRGGTLEVDRSKNLDHLKANPGKVMMNPPVIKNNRFLIDASAVIIGTLSKLKKASVDFNRYTEFGMPEYLKASRIVDRPSHASNALTTWNWMKIKAFGMEETSKHCFGVRIFDALPSQRGAGSTWNLARCPSIPNDFPKNLVHEYDDASSFSELTGSWYMESLTPQSENKIYVRYVIVGRLSTWVPQSMLEVIASSKFGPGVEKVIHALANQAPVDP